MCRELSKISVTDAVSGLKLSAASVTSGLDPVVGLPTIILPEVCFSSCTEGAQAG